MAEVLGKFSIRGVLFCLVEEDLPLDDEFLEKSLNGGFYLQEISFTSNREDVILVPRLGIFVPEERAVKARLH